MAATRLKRSVLCIPINEQSSSQLQEANVGFEPPNKNKVSPHLAHLFSFFKTIRICMDVVTMHILTRPCKNEALTLPNKGFCISDSVAVQFFMGAVSSYIVSKTSGGYPHLNGSQFYKGLQNFMGTQTYLTLIRPARGHATSKPAVGLSFYVF